MPAFMGVWMSSMILTPLAILLTYRAINDIGGMVNEASMVAGSGQDYQRFFQKAMKKFKIQEPSDLEDDKAKKKLFNWVDANYVSREEEAKKKAEAEAKAKEDKSKEEKK